jgi:hypothetical protein
MASIATDPFVHMNAVVKVDKVGQYIDPIPGYRLPGLKAVTNRRQDRALRPNLRVAVHANLSRGHARKGRGFDCGMAVPAIDTVIADMMLVTEGDWLIDRGSLAVGKRGTYQKQQSCDNAREDKDRAEDADSRKRVSTAVKDLGHLYLHARRCGAGSATFRCSALTCVGAVLCPTLPPE